MHCYSVGTREQLVDQRHLTVLLRLVVDDQQQLVHGELVDVDGKAFGVFRDWPAMVELLERHLAAGS
jgi:hypothetical protein